MSEHCPTSSSWAARGATVLLGGQRHMGLEISIVQDLRGSPFKVKLTLQLLSLILSKRLGISEDQSTRFTLAMWHW